MNIRKYTISAAFFSIALLILDSPTAFSGAAEGLELCIRTVIPALFPFFVLSIYLTSQNISFPILSPLCRLFRIPARCGNVLISSFLGGYPAGAKSVADAYGSGSISRDTANRMLAFCNQAGPSFLFGMVALQFPERKYPWLLWACQFISALSVSWLIPPQDDASGHAVKQNPQTFTGALRGAISVTASVCGWVILFRVVIAFLSRWFFWLLPGDAVTLLTGLLELTNGCSALGAVENVNLRFLLAAMILSFGGICVTMQTASVIDGLDIRFFLAGKLLQILITLILSSIYAGYPLPATAGCLLICCIFLTQRRNKSGNPLRGVV